MLAHHRAMRREHFSTVCKRFLFLITIFHSISLSFSSPPKNSSSSLTKLRELEANDEQRSSTDVLHTRVRQRPMRGDLWKFVQQKVGSNKELLRELEAIFQDDGSASTKGKRHKHRRHHRRPFSSRSSAEEDSHHRKSRKNRRSLLTPDTDQPALNTPVHHRRAKAGQLMLAKPYWPWP